MTSAAPSMPAMQSRVANLEAIYRDHLRRVRWVLRARGIGSDDLDDVVQDVFLAIHRRLPERDDAIAISTWVCGVARSVAYAYRRGNARRQRATEALLEPDAERLPDEELARRDAWRRLERTLAEIDIDQREAFVLVDVMGMRAAEAAELVAAPVNTVYSRLRLARRHCAAVLAPSDDARWLGLAVEGERPTAAQRERTWMRVVAALPVVATSSKAIALWAIAGAIALAIAVVVAQPGSPPAAKPDREAVSVRAAAPTVDIEPSAPTAIRSPAVAAPPPSLAPARVPAASPRRPRPDAPEPAQEPDALAQAVEILRLGEQALARGDASATLLRVDEYRRRFGEGPLARDVLRLERAAACSSGETIRATKAHAALAAMGLAEANEDPC